MSLAVRLGPVPVEVREAAYPLVDGRGGSDAQTRRDQLFLRAALMERRRAIAPEERRAFDARADEILARLDPPDIETVVGEDRSPIEPGDRVREPAWMVPRGCSPWRGVATSVAEDGWVCILTHGPTPYGYSRPPGEVELDTDPAT